MKLIYALFAIATAIIGHAIHSSIFWAFMDFLFPIFAWVKWALYHEVSVTIIKNAFSWFLQ